MAVGTLPLVVLFFVQVFVVVQRIVLNAAQFERFNADDFKVCAALGTRYNFTLIDFFLVDVQIAFALGTNHHDQFLPVADGAGANTYHSAAALLYLESLATSVK
jgi:hypothetical protein